MNDSSFAIVTPIWRKTPDSREVQRLKFSLSKNSEIPHFFIAPNGLLADRYKYIFPESKFVYFDKKYFVNISAYNSLMMLEDLYRNFIDFQRILILQLDALLVRKIEDEIFLAYDYVGAPWEPAPTVITFRKNLHVNTRLSKIFGKKTPVGNGGLSIRNPKAFLAAIEKDFVFQLILKYQNLHTGVPNEDVFWSYVLSRLGFSLPTQEQAGCFFLEVHAQFLEQVPDLLVGFHDLETYNQELENKILGIG